MPELGDFGRRAEALDAQRSPVGVADMGVLAEVFRNDPGVSVDDHPADRVAAVRHAARRAFRA